MEEINIIGDALPLYTYKDDYEFYYLKGNIFKFRILEENESVPNGSFAFNEENLKNEICKYNLIIDKKSAIGELGHTTTFDISLSKASHLINRLYYSNYKLYAEAKIIKTNSGKLIENIIEYNKSAILKLYPRAIGIKNERNVSIIKKLITFDIRVG